MICEKCGKEHDGSFGSGRFCCRACANSRKHTKETIQKISKGLQKHYEPYKKFKLKYFTGSEELDKLYPEIGKHQSKKWFIKLIPFGFDYTSLYTVDIIAEYEQVKSVLYTEYIINCLSPADIYKKYNCDKWFNNSETLLHLFKFMNFPIRGRSKAAINSVSQGKWKICANNTHSYGHEQWYTTWENKEVYLRSNLELNYAKYLDNNHIKYDVEYLRIKYFDSQKQIYRCAIPDFYLFESNTIVEIKSKYTLDIQNMKDKFKSYKELGYNVLLVLENNIVDLYSLED